MSNAYDVVVIGGGNSRFTAGLMRVAYNGVEDLKRPIPDLSPEEIERTDFGTYTEDQFLDDMARVTEYRCGPGLVESLANAAKKNGIEVRECPNWDDVLMSWK